MLKINIQGNIFSGDGYASHTKSLANALYKISDCRLTTPIGQGWERQVNDAEMDMITKQRDEDDYNIIVGIPHMWKMFTGLGKNIGYCVWEGNKVPDSWIEEFLNPKIDMIFVPSIHTKIAIENTIEEQEGTKQNKILDKIRIIPHGVDRDIFKQEDNLVRVEPFRFICNKGWRGTSWDRGGVQYLIKAFAEEFRKDEKVELFVKLNPAYINPEIINKSMEDLKLKPEHATIAINCEHVTTDRLRKFYNDSDCFVCATRAESFNLPGLEAMACGLPTIQTAYGGQCDYMNPDNSRNFEYDLALSEELPLYEGIQWAIPKIESIRKELRWAFENQDKIKEMGQRALEDSKDWTWDKSAERIIEVLK